MKLVFSKTNLAKAVGIVMKAVPAKTTMNILECILIDATTNEIKFTANDMKLVSKPSLKVKLSKKVKLPLMQRFSQKSSENCRIMKSASKQTVITPL